MKRREFIAATGAAGLAALTPGPISFASFRKQQGPQKLRYIAGLQNESPARAQVKIERGGPRLFLNGKEIYPFLALSTHLYPTLDSFRRAGINIYQPIVGVHSGWLGPGIYDWSRFDAFFDRLLELNPDAYFLPRLQLNTPTWWKDAHPDELIQYGLPAPIDDFDYARNNNLPLSEGGFTYRSGRELREASFASDPWRRDTAGAMKALLQHVESSPLRSRMIGYHPTTGRTGEWNYFGPDFLPDYSKPMQEACGPIPSVAERLNTTFGLLRDPEKERHVIEFYQKFHATIVESVLEMARAVKAATDGRVLCGVFYGYLLEQVRIQEGGYLGMRRVLASPDLDYIAGPYSYQPGNLVDAEGVRTTMADRAGNLFGHARGAAGDGGYRMMLESVRRHGKLFFGEMDPSTYLDADPHQVIGGHGGLGSSSLSGSLRILQRDLGQVLAMGIGGWLYDFGPLNKAPKGWYSSPEIVAEIRRLVELGKKRPELDITPVADMAAICDGASFAATQHWKTGRPWDNYGIRSCDFFNHWFLNTQSRGFHRMGAPIDFLDPADLRPDDLNRYQLLFMVNVFSLSRDEVEWLRKLLRNSGKTVVWFYAPGYIAPDKLDLDQMQTLTGFQFRLLREPGPMLIRSVRGDHGLPGPGQLRFGVDTPQWPRFAVLGEDAEALGTWTDHDGVAFARKEHDGFTSVYTGAAPLPIPVLRWLAREAKSRVWSSRPDIVRASEDAAMLVATSTGVRTLKWPKPMVMVGEGVTQTLHQLDLEEGDVRLFVAG